jgi:RNA-directed DNA polymerase
VNRNVFKLEVQVVVNKPNTDSKLNTVGWREINWRKVEKVVFKLQKRIYAASRRGDIKQVRQLQKTLLKSWSNKVLAVRRVTQDNSGKKTAGVDGVKSLSPEARLKLVKELNIKGKSKPTRRVWIPKANGEKRPLGIPTIHDRALQAVIKAALEPEWEAVFEPSSYGFRPGRSCQDAIKHIKDSIQNKPKFVLDADISKCFDRINHLALLQKTNQRGKIRRQLKAWLSSGVIDSGVFTATSEGTPQGGICSPLLANIALHGLEIMLKEFVKTLNLKFPSGKSMGWQGKVKSLTFIRYADDFLLMHSELSVVKKCKELISAWLTDIGLELKPEKTRIAHTLHPNLSEDGKAGFDFLGYHIRQSPVGKYKSSRHPSNGEILGFKTLLTPSKKAIEKHQRQIRDIIKKHRSSSQALLIDELNPVIRGWCNYYKFSDANKEFPKQDHLVWKKLRGWTVYRCNKFDKSKYWRTIGNNNWVFATREGNANPLRLLAHSDFSSSSTEYVKVKGDKSPFNGDSVYWSIRMGAYPEMPSRVASLLRQQKGKCVHCGLHFHSWDVLEVDHILPKALGGKDKWDNLQLLHRHCHDDKTAKDLIAIRKQSTSSNLEELAEYYSRFEWKWLDDIPLILGSLGSPNMTKGKTY